MRYIFNILTILVFGFHKLTADSVAIKNPLQQFSNEQNQKESNGILIQCNDDPKRFNFTSKSEFHVNCSLRRYQLKVLQTAFQRTVSFKCLENTTNIYNWLSSISKNAKSLDLSLNCIKTIPVLQNFSMLTTLKYKHNNIDYIEENAFSYLTALEVLDLSHNSLTGLSIRADIFRGNGSSIPLKSLNLGYNKIESIGYRTFLNLPKLRELHLSGNPLKIIDVPTSKAIQSIKSLEVLHLANTDLTTIPDDLFNGLKIKALYINKNYFTEVPEQLASLGRTLEFLDINENPIRILNSNSFMGLHSLKEIVAAGMKNLISVNQETFSRLTYLEQVVLSFNPQLVLVHPYAFSYGTPFSSSLKIVYLNNNNLKHISRYLLPWDQLEKLELSDNPWACDCSLRWMLDLEEKQNISIIKKSGMKCSFPIWPNISGFDVYGRPIRQFNCFGPSNIYMKYKTDLILRKTIFIALIAALLSVLCIIVLKSVVNYRRVNRQDDLVTLSASVNDAFKYYRIPNKPIQAT